MISILTLNAALLTVTLFGKPLYSFQGNPTKRFQKLVDFLNNSTYDVVCLQEVSMYWQKQLVNLVKKSYPHVTHYEVVGKVFPAELMILSRTPMTSIHFRYYQFGTSFENAGILKGVLFANIDIEGRKYTLADTHLVSNGFFTAPTTRVVEMVRGHQIKQLESFVGEKMLRDKDRTIIVVGDFNAEPRVSTSNYKQLANGFDDLFVADEQLHGKHDEQYTWMVANNDNFLSRLFCGDGGPYQRLDQFWVPKSQLSDLGKSIRTSVVHNDFSDHYGVELVIGRKSQ